MKMKKIYNKIKNNNKGHIHILQFSIQILHYKLHMTNFSVWRSLTCWMTLDFIKVFFFNEILFHPYYKRNMNLWVPGCGQDFSTLPFLKASFHSTGDLKVSFTCNRSSPSKRHFSLMKCMQVWLILMYLLTMISSELLLQWFVIAEMAVVIITSPFDKPKIKRNIS